MRPRAFRPRRPSSTTSRVYDDLVPILRRSPNRSRWRLKKAGIAGQTVVLKLKTADFKTRTRNRRLDARPSLPTAIFRTGMRTARKETDGTKFRLIGIGVTDLCDPASPTRPISSTRRPTRRAAAEAAMDTLRDKFGKKTVETGYTFGKGKRDR